MKHILICCTLLLSGCNDVTVSLEDIPSVKVKMDSCKSIGLNTKVYLDGQGKVAVSCVGTLK